MRLLFQKRPSGVFAPADPEAYEWSGTVAVGADIFLKPSRPRNPKQHRKMWGLINFVMDSTERFSNSKHFLVWLKLQVGHYDEFVMDGGELRMEPKSIAFASMSQDEFQPFYNEALEAIRRELFPTMSDHDIDAALSFYEGERW